jgi:hypothetical protein
VRARKASGSNTKSIDGGARAVDQLAQRIEPKALNPKPKPTQVATANYTVGDGRDVVGIVEHRGGHFVAVDTEGTIVGKFASLQEAMRAFPFGGRA